MIRTDIFRYYLYFFMRSNLIKLKTGGPATLRGKFTMCEKQKGY